MYVTIHAQIGCVSHPTPWPPPLQGAGEHGRPVSPLSLRERGPGGEGVSSTRTLYDRSSAKRYSNPEPCLRKD